MKGTIVLRILVAPQPRLGSVSLLHWSDKQLIGMRKKEEKSIKKETTVLIFIRFLPLKMLILTDRLVSLPIPFISKLSYKQVERYEVVHTFHDKITAREQKLVSLIFQASKEIRRARCFSMSPYKNQ